MELRIGITRSPREVLVDLPEDADRDAVKAEVESALNGKIDVLWMTDAKGGEVAIPSNQIAYIELTPPTTVPSVGFG